jgi:hypothetical protein
MRAGRMPAAPVYGKEKWGYPASASSTEDEAV